MNKTYVSLLFIMGVLTLLLLGCGQTNEGSPPNNVPQRSGQPSPSPADTVDQGTKKNPPATVTDMPDEEPSTQTDGENMPSLHMTVGSTSFTITLYDNASTQALLEKMPLAIEMIELNRNEKYYNFSDRLPTDSQRVGSIRVGDLMLYGSDTLVLFYEGFSTSYSYTPLGYMEDASGLAETLGQGDVKVTFSY